MWNWIVGKKVSVTGLLETLVLLWEYGLWRLCISLLRKHSTLYIIS